MSLPDNARDKYYIVAIAGQSNAVGFDQTKVDADYYVENERITQLGYIDEDNLKVVPLKHHAQSLAMNRHSKFYNINSPEFKGPKGPAYPVAKELLPYISDDYKVLVVNVAADGSKFAGTDVTYDEATMKLVGDVDPKGKKWGVNTALYNILINRIKYALDLNSDNKFLGLIWTQGESDNTSSLTTNVPLMFDAFNNFINTNYSDRKLNNSSNNIYATNSTLYWSDSKFTAAKEYTQTDFLEFAKLREYTQMDTPTSEYVNGLDGGATSGMHFGSDFYRKVYAPMFINKLISKGVLTGDKLPVYMVEDKEIVPETKPKERNPLADNLATPEDVKAHLKPLSLDHESAVDIADITRISINDGVIRAIGENNKIDWKKDTIYFGKDVYAVEFSSLHGDNYLNLMSNADRTNFVELGMSKHINMLFRMAITPEAKANNNNKEFERFTLVTKEYPKNVPSGENTRVLVIYNNTDKEFIIYGKDSLDENTTWYKCMRFSIEDNNIAMREMTHVDIGVQAGIGYTSPANIVKNVIVYKED